MNGTVLAQLRHVLSRTAPSGPARLSGRAAYRAISLHSREYPPCFTGGNQKTVLLWGLEYPLVKQAYEVLRSGLAREVLFRPRQHGSCVYTQGGVLPACSS